MNASHRFRGVAVLALLASVAVIAALWRSPARLENPSATPAELARSDAPSSATRDSFQQQRATPGPVTTREIPGDSGEPPIAPPLTLQKGELPWEARIRQIVGSPGLSETEKSRLLLEALPTLPIEGRETATEEAVKRLPDRDYRVAQKLVLNGTTDGSAMAILWTDLMERPDDCTLPTLLQVARNSAHPYAPFAQQNLQLLLGQDFGADWKAWDAAIQERLRAAPNAK